MEEHLVEPAMKNKFLTDLDHHDTAQLEHQVRIIYMYDKICRDSRIHYTSASYPLNVLDSSIIVLYRWVKFLYYDF